MLAGLSSTTRTVAISGDRLTSGHRPPDLGREAVAVELGLLDDRSITKPFSLARSSAVICLAVTTRIGMRRRVGLSLERLDHVEAVHLRHHQIEHDQVRAAPAARSRSPRGRRTRAAPCSARPRMRTAISSTALGSSSTTSTLSVWPCGDGKQAEIDERLVQLLPGDRLLHDRRGAEREALVAVGHDRDDDDRDAPRGRAPA